MKVAFVCAILAALAVGEKVYENHMAVRSPKNSTAPFWDYMVEHVDIWGAHEDSIDFRVTPQQFAHLQKQGLPMTVISANVQTAIDEEYARIANSSAHHATFPDPAWFTEYHTYEQINQWFDALTLAFPQRVRRVGTIGTTVNGRVLTAYAFSDWSVGGAKPQAYIQALIHAREWIAGATVQWIADRLAQANDAETLAVLRDYEIHVVPMMNPDGYAFTWPTSGNSRMWRKNRRPNGNNIFGVDNNRNFDDNWGRGGSSTNPSSDTYMGPSVASEPETQAVQRYVCSLPRVIAAVDYHSYSQLILRPYGWTQNLSPDEVTLRTAGDQWRDNIRAVSGLTYTSQRSIQLYVTTGTTSDWFYGARIRECLGHRTYGYTIELRPVGANPGFQLPPTQIIPTGQENYPSFLRFLQYARANPLSGQ